MHEIHGEAATGFEPVREAFEKNFAERDEVGACFCLHRRGEKLVDLWGGVADPASGRAWQRDTLQIVFSATKGVTAVCIHRLVEAGKLELDAPIASYWPEFAAQGKGEIPVRWALSHKAGLAAVEGRLTLDDVLAWGPVVRAIAAQAPNWAPGSAHGYHARSFGWILGELVRRVTGETLGTWFAREIAQPLGLDFWIGLPEALLPRCATLVPPDKQVDFAALLGADSLTAKVMNGPSGLFAYDEMWNRADVLGAEMPASNGVGDARSLSRLYAALIGEVDGIRLLSAEAVERARQVASQGPDKVLLVPSTFGLGFALPPMLGPACGEQSFGHPGAGGSLGFADPEAGIAVGYAMNRMKLGLEPDTRAAALVEAVYACL